MNTKEKLMNEGLAKMIHRLTRFLRENKIDYDEYASNIIIQLVGASLANIDDCLSDLSKDEKLKLVNYARSYFDENGFMPHPTVFMVDTRRSEEVEKKRLEMRPKYVQLMEDLETLTKPVL